MSKFHTWHVPLTKWLTIFHNMESQLVLNQELINVGAHNRIYESLKFTTAKSYRDNMLLVSL